jgi:hypothetical protein
MKNLKIFAAAITIAISTAAIIPSYASCAGSVSQHELMERASKKADKKSKEQKKSEREAHKQAKEKNHQEKKNEHASKTDNHPANK